MEELIQQLQAKAGLTAEQALKAIDTVKDYVKSKLPPMLADNAEQWFSGLAAKAQQKEEDFLEKARDWGEGAKDQAADLIKNAADKLGQLFDGKKEQGSL